MTIIGDHNKSITSIASAAVAGMSDDGAMTDNTMVLPLTSDWSCSLLSAIEVARHGIAKQLTGKVRRVFRRKLLSQHVDVDDDEQNIEERDR